MKNLTTSLAIASFLSFGTQAFGQMDGSSKAVSVADQITITSDYVDTIMHNMDALKHQTGTTSHDYEIASKNLSERISKVIADYKKNITNMVLIPMNRPVDDYNDAVTSPNTNIEKKKNKIESTRQDLISDSTTYESVYHQLVKTLYEVTPSLVISQIDVVSKPKKVTQIVLSFNDGFKTEKRIFDGQVNPLDANSAVKNGLRYFSFKFRDSNGQAGPFVTNDRNSNAPFLANLTMVKAWTSAPVNITGNWILSTLYPDVAYQVIYNECKQAANGASPSQTCMTRLRSDYQKYFLNVRNNIDRDMKFLLVDGTDVTLNNTSADAQYSFEKLILPSLAGIEYPFDFNSAFPVSN